ncbi:MAG: lyase family protein, partial [Terriglobales bacterium]
THRDRLGALMCACGVLTGSLGKMARDISLLMQDEVAEVAEPGGSARGGSSTMQHKHNPVGCVLTLAAANRVPGLVATFLSAMIQEHERGAGGWQSEWPTVAAIVQATGRAINSMAEVMDGLTVNPERMRSNIEATRGTVFAEKAMTILTQHLGRDLAEKLLGDATQEAVSQRRRLSEVLADTPEIMRHLHAGAVNDLEVPELYLGVAEEFRTRLLSPLAPDARSKKK